MENKDKQGKTTENAGIGQSVKSTFRAYKAEFRKIVWPSWPTLFKHTATVIVVSLIFGAYIALTDGILGALFTRFVQLVN